MTRAGARIGVLAETITASMTALVNCVRAFSTTIDGHLRIELKHPNRHSLYDPGLQCPPPLLLFWPYGNFGQVLTMIVFGYARSAVRYWRFAGGL